VPGKITRIAVTYTVDTPEGPRHTFHGLPHMQRHIRPERLSELIDDLTVICEDLIATREPAPGNGLMGLPRRARRPAKTPPTCSTFAACGTVPTPSA
jgi:hypothetical protein